MGKKTKFICEICKKKTNIKYEGTEPNTCEACMPKNLAKFQRKYELWNS